VFDGSPATKEPGEEGGDDGQNSWGQKKKEKRVATRQVRRKDVGREEHQQERIAEHKKKVLRKGKKIKFWKKKKNSDGWADSPTGRPPRQRLGKRKETGALGRKKRIQGEYDFGRGTSQEKDLGEDTAEHENWTRKGSGRTGKGQIRPFLPGPKRLSPDKDPKSDKKTEEKREPRDLTITTPESGGRRFSL